MTTRRHFLGALTSPLLLGRRLPSAPPERAIAKPHMPAELGQIGTSDFWRRLRGEFTIPADEGFFNNGTLGSSPLAVQETVIEHLRHVDRDIAHWDYKPDHENYFTGY